MEMGVVKAPDPGSYAFKQHDLDSNRRGFVINGQREWLKMTARGIRGRSTSSALAGLGIVALGRARILGMFLQNEDTRAALFSGSLNLPTLAASALIGAILIGLGVLFTRRRTAQLELAPLQAVEGRARFEQSYSCRSAITTYYVHGTARDSRSARK